MNTSRRGRRRVDAARALIIVVASALIGHSAADVSLSDRQRLQEIATALPYLEVCSRTFPQFAEKNRAALLSWKSRNAQAIRQAELDPVLTEDMRKIRERSGVTTSA